MRRATGSSQVWLRACDISIHALHEESDITQSGYWPDDNAISIHALHEESDRKTRKQTNANGKFQSTLSMRRATFKNVAMMFNNEISIHALHEESDNVRV